MSKKYANLTNGQEITITTNQFNDLISYLKHTRRCRKGNLQIEGDIVVDGNIKLANLEVYNYIDINDNERTRFEVYVKGVSIELDIEEINYYNNDYMDNRFHEFNILCGSNYIYITIQG